MTTLKKIIQSFKEFLFGAFYMDLYRDSARMAREYKDFINLLLLGEFLGLPILSTSITLRLIPYLYGDLANWKRRQLAERDVTDEVPDIM